MATSAILLNKSPSIAALLTLVLIASMLSACDSSPIEQIKALTEDKYPVANMPDEPLETPLEINIEPKRLAMTSSWSAGVKDDGTLWTWGTSGLLRETKTGQDPTPRQVEGVNDAVAVSGGSGHMLLLRKDGTVWGWGSNSKSQIDPNDEDTFIEELRQIEGIGNVIDINAGSHISFFVTKSREVFVLGKNEAGFASDKRTVLLEKPTKVEDLYDIIKIDGESDSVLALNSQGDLFAFSETNLTRTSKKFIENTQRNYKINKINFLSKVTDFSSGYANIVLLDDGTVWTWGDGEYSAQGATSGKIIEPQRVNGLSKVVKINSVSANTTNHDLYVWGTYVYRYQSSSLGSTKDYIQRPVRIAQNITVKQYGTGGFADYSFIDEEGNAWMWGDKSDRGQWGTGEITEDYMPKEFVLSLHQSLFNIHSISN
ncbi:hypothetical protein [Psychrobacter sp. 16-MNA-CIBAN-0192]|uniref:RCC1 domain-containing protein n=1 Tax=Psychrobacter sp. 16-MNA-CIBAN-0192 TaxID=3140448 RepID=UPI00331CC2CE